MKTIELGDIPQLDANVLFDTEEAHSQNVVHPIFVPILFLTSLVIG